MIFDFSTLISNSSLLFFVLFLGINVLVWMLYRVVSRFSEFFAKSYPFFLCLSLFLALKIPLIFVEVAAKESILTFSNVFAIAALVYLVFRLLDVIIFDFYLMELKQLYVPPLLHNIIIWLIYLIIIIVLLRTVFSLNITPLMATSAVFSMVIGLAMQDVLFNLFSGIILSIEQPFIIGDLIKVNGQRGQVIQINWRTTKIKTWTNDYVVIPNGTISKAELINYYKPTRLHKDNIPIGVSYDAPPAKVKKVLLDVAAQVKGVRRRPNPEVFIAEYADHAINYNLRVWIDDFSDIYSIKNEIYSLIWYQFRRHNISIPYPIREVNLHNIPSVSAAEQSAIQAKEILPILKKIPVLQPLSEKEQEMLANNVEYLTYTKTEIVFEADEPGECFYIIKSGAVEVCTEKAGGEMLPIAQLRAEDYFGEMSLLTGENRTATVRVLEDTELLVVNKEAFKEILEVNPSIIEQLSQVLHERQMETSTKLIQMQEKLDRAPPSVESSTSLLKSIRKFFGI